MKTFFLSLQLIVELSSFKLSYLQPFRNGFYMSSKLFLHPAVLKQSSSLGTTVKPMVGRLQSFNFCGILSFTEQGYISARDVCKSEAVSERTTGYSRPCTATYHRWSEQVHSRDRTATSHWESHVAIMISSLPSISI